MRLSLLSLGVFALTLLGLLSSTTIPASAQTINDLSWPNCNEKLTDLSFSGIIGVNNGLDLSKNPCLSSQSLLFHNSYSLYLNTGYPGLPYVQKYTSYPKKCSLQDSLCLAYDWGYNDALYSINYASSQDVHSFVWWLDVESDNSWSNNYRVNRQTLIGMINALTKNTFIPTIGFYAYPGQWQILTNSWKNNYPAWVATGSSSKLLAINYCLLSFDGGNVWLSQFTTKLDDNYVCSNKESVTLN